MIDTKQVSTSSKCQSWTESKALPCNTSGEATLEFDIVPVNYSRKLEIKWSINAVYVVDAGDSEQTLVVVVNDEKRGGGRADPGTLINLVT